MIYNIMHELLERCPYNYAQFNKFISGGVV